MALPGPCASWKMIVYVMRSPNCQGAYKYTCPFCYQQEICCGEARIRNHIRKRHVTFVEATKMEPGHRPQPFPACHHQYYTFFKNTTINDKKMAAESRKVAKQLDKRNKKRSGVEMGLFPVRMPDCDKYICGFCPFMNGRVQVEQHMWEEHISWKYHDPINFEIYVQTLPTYLEM